MVYSLGHRPWALCAEIHLLIVVVVCIVQVTVSFAEQLPYPRLSLCAIHSIGIGVHKCALLFHFSSKASVLPLKQCLCCVTIAQAVLVLEHPFCCLNYLSVSSTSSCTINSHSQPRCCARGWHAPCRLSHVLTILATHWVPSLGRVHSTAQITASMIAAWFWCMASQCIVQVQLLQLSASKGGSTTERSSWNTCLYVLVSSNIAFSKEWVQHRCPDGEDLL